MKNRSITPWLFLTPNLLGFLTFTLLPIVASLGLAFCSWDMFHTPRWVGFSNFYELIGFKPKAVTSLPLGLIAPLTVLWAGAWSFSAWREKGLRRLMRGLAAIAGIGAACYLAFEAVNPRFFHFIGNTLYLLIGLPFSIMCSLWLAILLNRKIYGRNFFRLIFFLPSIVSGVGIFLLWKWVFNTEYGLFNSLIKMIFSVDGPAWLESTKWAKNALIILSVWATAGGANMILYLAALQNVDPELYEAASIDGASSWSQFRNITWPLVSPTTAFIFTMGLIGGFQGGFDSAYVMTRGGPAGATTTLSYYIYENGFGYFYMGRAAAASWVLFLMVLTITWLNWKWMSQRVHY